MSYGRQSIDEEDIAAVVSVLRSDWLTTGPVVSAFENALSQRIKSSYVAACSSGTAGLHLALLALGIGPGDTVVVPAVTFVATANVVRYAGAEVVFADVDPDTGLMDTNHLEEVLNNIAPKKIRAIISVHLNGQCSDQPGIQNIAKRYGIKVIEDACHAIGTSYFSSNDWIPVGACRHSDITVFSFHPVKTITMGEGGAVATNDRTIYEKILSLRNHGLVHGENLFEHKDLAHDDHGNLNPWYYELQQLGFNYRASDIHCALGLSQLSKLEKYMEHRHFLVNTYRDRFQKSSPFIRLLEIKKNCKPSWHIHPVLIDFKGLGITRAAFMNELRKRSIGCQVHYIPLYYHPYYRKIYGDQTLCGAEKYYQNTLTLPLHMNINRNDVDYIVETVLNVINKTR